MVGEFIVAFVHEEEPNAIEVQAFEYDGVFFGVKVLVLLKINWHIGPMHIGFEVMPDVVAVIEAMAIVEVIDTGDAIAIVILRRIGVNECVLPPVACHHGKAHDQ